MKDICSICKGNEVPTCSGCLYNRRERDDCSTCSKASGPLGVYEHCQAWEYLGLCNYSPKK